MRMVVVEERGDNDTSGFLCPPGWSCRTTPSASATPSRNYAWGSLSHYPDAERAVAWLLDRLAERDARITELEARLRHDEWAFRLP